ncbi:DNA-(apurinic or apyrimidinic site) lyase [Desulfonispora thiosulfatigenes DSM 11270]|uniref:Formamidopyrimidine-DNA glycosylase n=1 Tax=Desulfonispora thiosulfatigenes DSM 11270 TaxID=656914 RepID=A0A1W1VHW4_DESTI|nr:DNA-formamidopyrimidine glycosylase [Desulfonispora thiosulfatigenes]SMB92918.1 DNA-(apurinic or apyrimidinic site) lyase [Desulfonispora thiosulfatigenes DSM 11270]
MPELPEVETIKRSLLPLLVGKKIINVDIKVPNLLKYPLADKEHFEEVLKGSTFLDIQRRGKYLLFHLNKGWILVIHLRMTGRLLYTPKDQTIEKHTHVIFSLDDGNDLRFHDIRKFGLIYLVPQDGLHLLKGLSGLGPEPLSDDFSLDSFKLALKNKKQKIKPLLLNQNFIAGIGNIYADEILFQAKVHPEEIISNLGEDKIEKIYDAIRDRLTKGIEFRGTSIKDYVDGLGQSGMFQNELKIYGKKGELCLNCGHVFERINVGGRSSTICPWCQKKN